MSYAAYMSIMASSSRYEVFLWVFSIDKFCFIRIPMILGDLFRNYSSFFEGVIFLENFN